MATSDKNTVVTQGFIDKLIDKIGKILKDQHTLVERDEEQAESIELLLEKVSSIENNFEELTKSLAKGSYPLKLARSIKAEPSSIKPHIIPVDLTKAQLIETYNELVAVLSGYIIPVTLTPDSYRGSNSDGIILETTVKGNYWAVTTIEEKQHKYWLVPNNNISFNIHKLKTVESLFQLKGDYDSPNSDFILEEPAVLSLLPDNKQWKLLQPGVLFFGSSLQSRSPQLKQPKNVVDEQQSKLEQQILSSLTAFQTTIDKLNSKISQLEIQSEISEKVYQRDKQEWLAEKHVLNEKLGEIDKLKSNLDNFNTKVVNSFNEYNQVYIEDNNHNGLFTQESDRHVNNDSNLINDYQESSLYAEIGDRKFLNNSNNQEDIKNQDNENKKINLTTQISQFRQAYTQDIKLIQDLIIAKVAISVETLEQITFYKPDLIILENTSHGKYWIIDYSGNYFLIPSAIQHITDAKETSLTIARLLFHLSGYYPQYSSYHLIRPAIVTKVSTNQWKLEEKGKFNFS